MCKARSSCCGDCMDPAVRRKEAMGTGTSRTQEHGNAEGIQTKEDILLELSLLNFGRAPWWTCSTVPTPYQLQLPRRWKDGCSNISGRPFREFTLINLQVDSPCLHLLSCATYQAAQGWEHGFLAWNLPPRDPLSYPWFLATLGFHLGVSFFSCFSKAIVYTPGRSCCFSQSHKNLPFLGAFLLRLYCFLCWYFYW